MIEQEEYKEERERMIEQEEYKEERERAKE